VRRPVTALDCWIIEKYVVRMGGGWNWLRIMSNGGGISSTEPSGTATRGLISKMDHRKICCEDGRRMELAQDCV